MYTSTQQNPIKYYTAVEMEGGRGGGMEGRRLGRRDEGRDVVGVGVEIAQ